MLHRESGRQSYTFSREECSQKVRRLMSRNQLWPDSQETGDLLRNAEIGGASAVNTLLERHRDGLRVIVQARLDRALARRVDASDIVQDAMFEASQRLTAYLADGKMPFHLWLRQIALDRIIDSHRRHRVAARRSLDREQPLDAAFADRSSLQLAAQLKDQGVTPAAAALRKELEQRFLAALSTMDEPDREILLMRHFEQLSNGEAATALGLSPSAAGMRHLRALRRLRQILGESGSQVAAVDSSTPE
jgi:RNA polymerase sigma-70 factor (ECF subfamily)